MKKIVNFVVVISIMALLQFSITLRAQHVHKVTNELPDCYKYTYRIFDYKNTNCIFDQRQDGNMHVWGIGHNGGWNQQWLILPLDPAGDIFVVANYMDGRILFPNPTKYLNCFNGRFDQTNKQMWFLDKVGANRYYVYNKGTSLVWDRKQSKPYKDYIYVSERFDVSNQQIGFSKDIYLGNNMDLSYGQIPNVNINNLPLPTRPTSINDTRSQGWRECETLLSKTIIPYVLVVDPVYDIKNQAQRTPYYRVERYGFWEIIWSEHRAAAGETTHSKTYEYGLTNSSSTTVQNTLSVNYSIGSEFNILENKAVKFSIKNNFQQNLGTTVTEVSEYSTTAKSTTVMTFTHPGTYDVLMHHWARGEEFRVYRMDGSLIQTFKIIHNRDVAYIDYSYPKAPIIIDRVYELANAVAKMESDNFPSGSTTSSSTNGKGYEPYLAFDRNYATMWMSGSEKKYVPQWIAYDFEQEAEVQSYTIEVSDKNFEWAPKSWEFQAWNGQKWITVDSRKGHAIDYWKEKQIRTFTLDETQPYNEFRLYFHEVNGATEVAIVDFAMSAANIEPESSEEVEELTGKEEKTTNINPSSLKETEELIDIEELTTNFDVEIYPNPSDGKFAFKIIKKQAVNDQEIKTGLSQLADVRIFNSQGVLVQQMTNCSVNTMYNLDVTPGLYILVFNLDGAKIQKTLIIK